MDVRLYDSHKSTVEALRWAPPIVAHEVAEVIMTYIYMDGTDGARKVDGPQGRAASAFCAIHELVSGAVRFGGFSGTVVDLEVGGDWYRGATKASNRTAEVQASIMASFWVLQSEFRADTLCYDAEYAENIASALASRKTNERLANLASALRRSVHAVCSCVYSQHVKVHE